MQLVQIGQQPAAPATRTVLEMFMELAEREAEFTRAAREQMVAKARRSREH